MGKIGVANSKMAYKIYEDLFATEEWKELEKVGARAQRLLWASTGTKNAAYPDTLYVDELIDIIQLILFHQQLWIPLWIMVRWQLL